VVNGPAIVKFRLAVNRPVTGQDGVGADLIDIVGFEQLAKAGADGLKKGQLVLVDGRIQNRSFEDQSGQRHWVTEVIARSLTMLEASPGVKATIVANPTIVGSQKATVTNQAAEPVDDFDLVNDLPF
jgi:single stranded DNA-binding protein